MISPVIFLDLYLHQSLVSKMYNLSRLNWTFFPFDPTQETSPPRSSSQSPRSPPAAPFLYISVTEPVKLGNGVQAYISYRVITRVNLCPHNSPLLFWNLLNLLFLFGARSLLSFYHLSIELGIDYKGMLLELPFRCKFIFCQARLCG